MKGRRTFITSLSATVGSVAFGVPVLGPDSKLAQSIVPKTRSTAPNYWCTWAAQNYLYGRGARELDTSVLEGGIGAEYARNLVNEHVILGPEGWSKTFHPKARGELFLLLDDGWEKGGTASFELDHQKFPSFSGPPQKKLGGLNSAVRADGWRALALWCRDTPGYEGDKQRMNWSKEASVPYLKIDGGDQSGSMARARAIEDAAITLEHIYSGEDCVNGDWKHDGRFGAQPWGSPRLRTLCNTDVYRTYDATAVLGVPTTLDRAAELLNGAAGHSEVRSLLNVEDEVYLAAVLGCTMGIMRHPLRGLRPTGDVDVFFPPPRQLKRRMDEIVRAVRWQRLAPPYAAGAGAVTLDTQILVDDWVFRRGDTFDSDFIGHRVRQGAPARVARNMDLPLVSCEGAAPYVVCTRFPGGAAAIGAFERVSTERQVIQPRAQVRWMMGDAAGPFGIFGQFGMLTLVFRRRVQSARILAQDLAGDTPVDVTDGVKINGNEITLPGKLIDRVGLSNATPDDLSMPGLVLVV